MQEINYIYNIKSVSEENRCMEIVYSATGHETITVGVRLPYVGEDLEDVIHSFSPVPIWLERMQTTYTPKAGTIGVLSSLRNHNKEEPKLMEQEFLFFTPTTGSIPTLIVEGNKNEST